MTRSVMGNSWVPVFKLKVTVRGEILRNNCPTYNLSCLTLCNQTLLHQAANLVNK